MGSDMRNKSNSSSKGGTIRFTVAFLGGCFVTLFFQWMCSVMFSSNRNCAISFGSYKGTQYTNERAGTIGSPKCLVESKFLKVQQHSVRLPSNGDKSSALILDWIWIDYHDRINVLIEAESASKEPHFLIFEQTKYALEGRESLAIVGGIIEPNEQPEKAAHREVLEETGQDCASFHFLGRYRTDVNRGMGWTNTYVATDCQKQHKRRTEHNKQATDEVGIADAERQDLRILSLTDLRKALQAGQFLEIQWSATVALAILNYEKKSSR